VHIKCIYIKRITIWNVTRFLCDISSAAVYCLN